MVNQFVTTHSTVHWRAILCILRYPRGTQFCSEVFPSTSSVEFHVYSDADWDSNVYDYKSTIGYCFFLGHSLISWKSSIQDVVLLQWHLAYMGGHISQLISLHCNNENTIMIAKNSMFDEHTKHIDF